MNFAISQKRRLQERPDAVMRDPIGPIPDFYATRRSLSFSGGRFGTDVQRGTVNK